MYCKVHRIFLCKQLIIIIFVVLSRFIVFFDNIDCVVMESIDAKSHELGALFKVMAENYSTFGDVWKNIELGKKAFSIIKDLPDVVEGEFDAPVDKVALLSYMLEQMDETLSPRFCIEVRRYIKALNVIDEANNEALEQLQDYIDENISMDEYCKKYGKLLRFDPVERTEKWEDVIYDVEGECADLLKEESRGMGYCFAYWSTKRAVLKKYDICWKTPSVMNPRVMFD